VLSSVTAFTNEEIDELWIFTENLPLKKIGYILLTADATKFNILFDS